MPALPRFRDAALPRARGRHVFKGLDASYKLTYQEMDKRLHDGGHSHPVSCVDCHDPESMSLRISRPAFIRGIQALAASDAPVPAFSSIAQWRQGKRDVPYDPNVDASRNEKRSFVCGQCHVEYYCSAKMPLTVPWGRGLGADPIEAYWDAARFPDGSAFYDYEHQETGAQILKAQHPESNSGARGSMRGAASPAPIATCLTCARARRRSVTTGCGAHC